MVTITEPGHARLVVGNWKMNGDRASIAELLAKLKTQAPFGAEVAVCPPAAYLGEVALGLQGSMIAWGAQDVSDQENGAFTGEVSAAMLSEFGCHYAIVGHSERRTRFAESDRLVADKAKAALAHRITPIVCVGETLAERGSGVTEAVVKRQLSAVIHALAHCIGQIVVAYEPLWAIGTGQSATPEQANAVHHLLRQQLHAATERADLIKILYGGSVNAANAAAFFAQPAIDGALVGGASLKADTFAAICRAAR